jgi:ATP-dependent helicase/nuclease subunit A
VHQAKGLEFPIVVLWDGRQLMRPSDGGSAWRMDRDGRGWAIRLEKLEWEEPAGTGIAEREAAYAQAERKRVVYVAATRARDVLIVPQAGAVDERTVSGQLLLESDPELLQVEECYVAGAGASWSRAVSPPPAPTLEPAGDFERRVRARWVAAAATSARPQFAPIGVARAAHATVEEEEAEDGEAAAPERYRPGRFGPQFGDTVHRAIGMVFREPKLAAEEAVRRAVRASGLAEHLDEAAADVARAVAALKREGLLRALGADLRLEYPVAGAGENGTLEVGYVDLISSDHTRIDLIDFKTDPPPSGGLAASYPAYVAQVRAYERLLAAADPAGKSMRAALLFTADGSLHVVE